MERLCAPVVYNIRKAHGTEQWFPSLRNHQRWRIHFFPNVLDTFCFVRVAFLTVQRGYEIVFKRFRDFRFVPMAFLIVQRGTRLFLNALEIFVSFAVQRGMKFFLNVSETFVSFE